MKNISKGIISLICAVSLIGCEDASNFPHPTELQKTNGGLQVNNLGKTPDGCTIYRFYDDGYEHYFVKCINSNNTTVSSQVPNGKYTRPEDISETNVNN